MVVNEDGTISHIDEDEFVQLATTSALSRFGEVAQRAIYRWYEELASKSDNAIKFDPYEMTREWRELSGQALVIEYGRPSERDSTDEATINTVWSRLKEKTTAIRVGHDDYLVRLVNPSLLSYRVNYA